MGKGSHFHDVGELFVHVAQRELAVFDLLDELLVIVQFQFVDLVDEPFDIAETEQFADERLRLERFQIVNVLAGSDENHRTLRSCDTTIFGKFKLFLNCVQFLTR